MRRHSLDLSGLVGGMEPQILRLRTAKARSFAQDDTFFSFAQDAAFFRSLRLLCLFFRLAVLVLSLNGCFFSPWMMFPLFRRTPRPIHFFRIIGKTRLRVFDSDRGGDS